MICSLSIMHFQKCSKLILWVPSSAERNYSCISCFTWLKRKCYPRRIYSLVISFMQCTRYVTKYPNKSAVLYNCIITQNRHSPNLTISGNYYFFCHQVSLVSLTELCTQNMPVLYTYAWFFRLFTIKTFQKLVPNLSRGWIWSVFGLV